MQFRVRNDTVPSCLKQDEENGLNYYLLFSALFFLTFCIASKYFRCKNQSVVHHSVVQKLTTTSKSTNFSDTHKELLVYFKSVAHRIADVAEHDISNIDMITETIQVLEGRDGDILSNIRFKSQIQILCETVPLTDMLVTESMKEERLHPLHNSVCKLAKVLKIVKSKVNKIEMSMPRKDFPTILSAVCSIDTVLEELSAIRNKRFLSFKTKINRSFAEFELPKNYKSIARTNYLADIADERAEEHSVFM